MLEEGFDLEFESGLPLNGVFISLGDAFEDDALILGGLPDGFEFVEAQKASQREGITFVMFVVILADEAVAARITDDELLDMRYKQLADPAGEVGFFKHQALVRGGDVLDPLD